MLSLQDSLRRCLVFLYIWPKSSSFQEQVRPVEAAAQEASPEQASGSKMVLNTLDHLLQRPPPWTDWREATAHSDPGAPCAGTVLGAPMRSGPCSLVPSPQQPGPTRERPSPPAQPSAFSERNVVPRTLPRPHHIPFLPQSRPSGLQASSPSVCRLQ